MTESLNIILMSNYSNNSVGVIQNTEVDAALQHGSWCASGAAVNSSLKQLITGKDKMDHRKKIFFKKAVVISC